MLSRFNGCWRWFTERADSPWYPTMRIFRQQEDRSWPRTIDDVQHALRRWVEEQRSPASSAA
jgi:hypothetical protein